jgi:hypothetical protein
MTEDLSNERLGMEQVNRMKTNLGLCYIQQMEKNWYKIKFFHAETLTFHI